MMPLLTVAPFPTKGQTVLPPDGELQKYLPEPGLTSLRFFLYLVNPYELNFTENNCFDLRIISGKILSQRASSLIFRSNPLKLKPAAAKLAFIELPVIPFM